MKNLKTCESCKRELHEDCFPVSHKYKRKDESVVVTKRKTCKACYAGKYRDRGREAKRDRINRLISWVPPLLITLVIGTYQFDSVSGRNRTCTYLSVYGYHSVTIDAMQMCPLTWEFEV